ncbi:MAG TPA: hypothetical protein VMB85_07955 [Bryobacteraceae bacterium]|nr:hypothetical protein [Bryobacteraceae bacterium]
MEIPGVRGFNAESVSVGIMTPSSTQPGGSGLALAGIPEIDVEVVVNAHDTDNLPFASLLELIQLAQKTTADQIGAIKITFWRDESHLDAICTCSFSGWINHFQLHSGGDGNHTVVLHLVPSWAETRPALSVSN